MTDTPARSVSVVMTYFERLEQLKNTLRSIQAHHPRHLQEIIIVDDRSRREPLQDGCLDEFALPIRIKRLTRGRHTNPCVAFNAGFTLARGEVVIIQNAECLHVDNIVDDAASRIGVEDYISYACYSTGQAGVKRLNSADDILAVARSLVTNHEGVVKDGGDGWYNHSIHRPVAYHFAASMARSVLINRLGGFDPRYAHGMCCDDDEFLCRVRRAGLEVRIVDDRMVLHQWHYGGTKVASFARRFAYNRALFNLVTMVERTAKPSRFSRPYVEFVLKHLVRGALDTMLSRRPNRADA